MHYAFAPGATPYDIQSRHLLDDRPGTVLVSVDSVKHVEDFLGHLDTTAAIVKPLGGDLFLGSHGNHGGWLQIDLDGTKPVDTNYEVLEAAVASGSVVVPFNLDHNPDGSDSPISIHIRGCRIGIAEPFVDKLKEVFGGDSTVTAPKHFHVLFPPTYPNKNKGLFEYLAYSFHLVRRDPFAKKDDAVAAFKAESFTYIDGSAVPEGRWDAWIPTDVNKTRQAWSAAMPLGQKVGGVKVLTDATGREYRHDIKTLPFTVRDLTAFPPENQRLDTLRATIAPHPMFAATHPFPIQARFGHATADELIDGMTWAFTWDKPNMVCVGTQHEYAVIVPVIEPAPDPADKPPVLPSGNLLFNFYPHPGTAGAVVEKMPTTDGRLFYTAQ
jgi:hypothetical protein